LVGKKVTTTDAVETTCISVALSDDSVYHFTVEVIAEETTTNSEQASYKLVGTFYRDDGGGATIVGSVTQAHVAESTGTMDATLDANDDNMRVRVTGVAATSIRWIAYITYQKLSLS
jgi:hypothetical protein